MTRRLRRAVAVALFVSVGVGACNEPQRRILFLGGCGACGMVGRAGREIFEEDRARAASCGDCGDGRVCNTIAETPRCTASPGALGDPCGTTGLRMFGCADGTSCIDDACVALPGLGEPCNFEDGDIALDPAGPTFCGIDLVCGPGDRCQAGCPGGCTLPTRCDPLVSPPRCVLFAGAGEPCGRVHDRSSIPCAPLAVCIDRGGGPLCELHLEPLAGPACANAHCPPEFHCDIHRHACVAGP